jgi:hypothetical protein
MEALSEGAQEESSESHDGGSGLSPELEVTKVSSNRGIGVLSVSLVSG